MLRKIISPVQQWLLKNGQCVGCGRPLKMAKKKDGKNESLIFCACGRIFVKEAKGYRRALFEEV